MIRVVQTHCNLIIHDGSHLGSDLGGTRMLILCQCMHTLPDGSESNAGQRYQHVSLGRISLNEEEESTIKNMPILPLS